jgi:hypothetical protein
MSSFPTTASPCIWFHSSSQLSVSMSSCQGRHEMTSSLGVHEFERVRLLREVQTNIGICSPIFGQAQRSSTPWSTERWELIDLNKLCWDSDSILPHTNDNNISSHKISECVFFSGYGLVVHDIIVSPDRSEKPKRVREALSYAVIEMNALVRTSE